jgi:hypothetical protein
MTGNDNIFDRKKLVLHWTECPSEPKILHRTHCPPARRFPLLPRLLSLGKKDVTVAVYEPQKMCEKKSTIVTVTKTQFVTGTETQSRQLCDVPRPTTHEEKNRSLQESKKENLAVLEGRSSLRRWGVQIGPYLPRQISEMLLSPGRLSPSQECCYRYPHHIVFFFHLHNRTGGNGKERGKTRVPMR